MILHHAEIEFETIEYEVGDAPDFDKSCWLDVKYTLGLDFPNLPYMIDGSVQLTQSLTILHYLSSKTGLCIKDASQADMAKFDMLEHVGMDLNILGWDLMYASKEEFFKNKSAVIEKAKEFYFKCFSDYLGDKHYFAGNQITGTDFWLFDAFDRFCKLDPEIIEQQNLKDFMKRMMALPNLQDYFTSPSSTRNLPISNKYAFFK